MNSLMLEFECVDKPESLTRASVAGLDISLDRALFERYNWNDIDVSELENFGEVLHYITPEGFRYVAPRILQAISLQDNTAKGSEFVDTFFMLPQLGSGRDVFSHFSSKQRIEFWKEFSCLLSKLDSEDFPSFVFDEELAKGNIFGV